jgi:hypothetical protein
VPRPAQVGRGDSLQPAFKQVAVVGSAPGGASDCNQDESWLRQRRTPFVVVVV